MYKEKLEKFVNSLASQGFIVDDFSEFKFETMYEAQPFLSTQGVKDWYYKHVENSTMKVEYIPLSECKGWSMNENGHIAHSSNEFFIVGGYRVSGTGSREVKVGWDQPLLEQVGFDGGILGLLRKRINGVPHYLVEAKEEPGNYNIVQISTTVQATFSNLKRAHKGDKTNYSDIFLNPENYPVKVIIDQWTSEDGGRLFNKRNRSMLLEFDEFEELPLVSDRFTWVTLYQLKKLLREEDAIVAPHIRGVLACV